MTAPSESASVSVEPTASRPVRAPRRWHLWLAGLMGVAGLAGGLYLWSPWSERSASAATSTIQDWQQAQAALAERDFEGARNHLARCLAAWPLHAEVHFLMARTCRRLDDFGGWQFHLLRAAALEWPAEQLAFEQQLQQAQAGDVSAVRDALQEHLETFPQDQPLIREAVAKGYLDSDHFAEFNLLIQDWLKQDPNDWEAFLMRGRGYQRRLYFQKASDDYRKVLSLRPDQPRAIVWLADALVAQAMPAEARDLYVIHLRDHPNDADAREGLAACERAVGRIDEARTMLDELLRDHLDHLAALTLRGQLAMDDDDWPGAVQWLERAWKRAPGQVEVLTSLILALRHVPQRRADLDRYQEKLAQLRIQIEKRDTLRNKLLRDPDNVDLRYRLAQFELLLGNEAEATHDFQMALRLNPRHRPTCLALADYWQRHGDLDRAAYFRARAASPR